MPSIERSQPVERARLEPVERVAAPSSIDVETARSDFAPKERAAPRKAAAFEPAPLAGQAESLGFSPGVAHRVAQDRPDVIRDTLAVDPANAILRRTFLVHRGLHNKSLAEFQTRLTEPAYIDAQGHWAATFVTDKPGITQPDEGQLYRGFLLRLEVPGHFFPNLKDDAWANQVTKAGVSFVDTIAPTVMPDQRPFIREIGFAGPDKQMTFHRYEELFRPDGQLTPLAQALDAQMVPAPQR